MFLCSEAPDSTYKPKQKKNGTCIKTAGEKPSLNKMRPGTGFLYYLLPDINHRGVPSLQLRLSVCLYYISPDLKGIHTVLELISQPDGGT